VFVVSEVVVVAEVVVVSEVVVVAEVVVAVEVVVVAVVVEGFLLDFLCILVDFDATFVSYFFVFFTNLAGVLAFFLRERDAVFLFIWRFVFKIRQLHDNHVYSFLNLDCSNKVRFQKLVQDTFDTIVFDLKTLRDAVPMDLDLSNQPEIDRPTNEVSDPDTTMVEVSCMNADMMANENLTETRTVTTTLSAILHNDLIPLMKKKRSWKNLIAT
jgi:hypothetical protein